nr:peptidoglycan DD-metalloendopeptidase family protein [Lentibacillus sp. JNUCC-1]
MLSCITLFWGFSSTTILAGDHSLFKKVYHVYVGEEHIGEIEDPKFAEDILDHKLAAAKTDEKGINLVLSEEVSYVEERVFNPKFTNEEVADYLEKEISVLAEAVELKAGDQTVGYFKNEDTAQKLIHKYKTKFVDSDVLDTINSLKQETSNDGADFNRLKEEDITLEPGDKMVTDVTLSENVSYETIQVEPKQMMSIKQGMKKLQKGTLEDKVHKVEKGDVLESIAQQYDLTKKTIMELNEGLTDETVLQIDQEIHVTEYEPLVKVLVKEEERVEKKIAYETEHKQSDELLKGETKVKQKGKDGKKQLHYVIQQENGKAVKKEVANEKVTKEPVNKIVIEGTKVIPSRGTGTFTWPAHGGYVSSHMGARWGRMHKGIDIAGPSSRGIKAADNGVVVSAGADGSYGNRVVISHNNGMKTLYAHLSSIKVHPGQVVQKGQQIGIMGSTGRSTGIHLHFEVYKNGALQNPLKYY